MKNKKGFTLIELLVTIALMLSMLGLAIVSFINISNRKKEETYNLVKDQIITAAEQYFDSNEYLFEGLSGDSFGIISVGKLVEEDYLNKVTDPRDGKSINYCNQVQVTKENGIYKSTYQETKSTNCPDIINSVIVSEAGAPNVKVTLEGTSGDNGWYKSNVNLTATVDTKGNGAIKSVERCYATGSTSCFNFSGLSEVKEIYNETIGDTKEITIGYKVTNISGKTSMGWETLKVDTKAPSCETTVTGGTLGNNTGGIQWYKGKNQPVIKYIGSDELSGVSGVYQYSGNDLIRKTASDNYTESITSAFTGNYNAIIKDKAGNENQCGGYYGYDNTKPSCTLTTKKDPDSNGWFNQNSPYVYMKTTNISNDIATWSWKTDSWSSSVYSYDSMKPNDIKDFYVTAEGIRTVTLNLVDKAGNEGKCTKEVKIDRTPPIITNATLSCDVSDNGNAKKQNRIVLTITDNFSGFYQAPYTYGHSVTACGTNAKNNYRSDNQSLGNNKWWHGYGCSSSKKNVLTINEITVEDYAGNKRAYKNNPIICNYASGGRTANGVCPNGNPEIECKKNLK